MKILILYFSGAGATEHVAQLICREMRDKADINICSVENADNVILSSYDALIIGTPVYHAAPARLVMDFFQNISLTREVPAFIFNTRAMWSGNTNRILAKALRKQNIITIMDRKYRGPASDGAIMMPSIKRFFEFEPFLAEKIAQDCEKFISLLAGSKRGYLPRLSISGALNALNKYLGRLITFKIYVHGDRCTQCMKCLLNCPHQAISADGGLPVVEKSRCENCYRCIHHCPGKAMSLSKRKTPEKVLYQNESK